jgi:DNA-binding SARP family transcriptional activator
MLFRVLGTFEVHRADAVVTPTAPRLRRALALLAVRANTTVHLGQLADELWGDRPPPGCVTILQTHLYQLRKLLRIGAQEPEHLGGGTEPAVALCARPTGYELRLAPGALDLHRFESLAEQGRHVHELGCLEGAAKLLQSALDVWRGPALDGVAPGPVLRAEVVRLETSRTRVLNLRVETDRRLGRHTVH